MKIDRLLGITTCLLNHKTVSAQTLAQRFEVSKRTIQRDMVALCLAGIPITTWLARIIRLENRGAPFSTRHRNAQHLLHECIANDKRRYFRIKLYCKSAVRQQVLEYLTGSITEELGSGDFIYETDLPEKERMWFSIIMGFGSQVTVLEPDEIRKKLMDTAAEIVKTYSPPKQ